MTKLLRISTVPESLQTLLKGQLAFMRENGFTVWVASASGCEEAQLEGCPHFSLPLTRRITPFQDLQALWKTYWLLRRLQPDIVHSHTPKAGLIGMVAAWLARVPVRLHTVAGLPLMERSGFVRWLLIGTERITYLCATAVWPNSFGLEKYIRKYIYMGSKLRVLGNGSSNGINISHFTATPALRDQAQTLRRRLAIPADAFVYVFVGRIVRDKGVDELITAFQGVSRSGRQVRLLLVGTYEEDLNPVRQETKAFIQASPEVVSVGYQVDVRPYVLMADVLALPSYREGLPNVLLQAGCLERPVITTSIVGCREIVVDGKTGLLVPPKNSMALQNAMSRLLTDRSLCVQMGQAARAQIATRYDQQTLWRTILQAYQEALQSV